MDIIKTSGLTKKFDKIYAVDNISFSVKKGEIFGFLGPNGAGKTTTIKSILGLIHPDEGSIKINNLDIKKQGKKAKRKIGYLPEKVAFYDNLTALQNLNFYAEMKNVPKKECISLIEEFGLKDSINKKVGKFSKGMIQRLGMARALLGDPALIILDEPTSGLDPRGVALIRDKIKKLKNKGKTVFISSHILAEVQEVCDRVGIINKGTLVAEDSVTNLSQTLNLKPKIRFEISNLADKIVEAVKKIKGVENIKIENNYLEVACTPKTKSKVVLAIEQNGGNITNLQTKEISLEEVFLKYTTDTGV